MKEQTQERINEQIQKIRSIEKLILLQSDPEKFTRIENVKLRKKIIELSKESFLKDLITPAEIAKMFSKKFGFDIHKKTRKREVVQVRQIAHYYAVQCCENTSLAKIGLDIGAKDHATVLHSVKTVLNLIDANDKKFMEAWNTAEILMRNKIV